MNDDEMDVALREYGERWRAAQSVPPAVPGFPRTTRWPVALGVAASVLAIVGAAGVVVVRRGAESDPPVAARPTSTAQAGPVTVPWQPNPAPDINKGPSPPPAETAPPCADADLDMVARFAPLSGGQRGPVAGVLEIRNTGKFTCRVQSKFSWFPVGVKEPDGLGVTDELGPAAVMAPGDLAVSSLNWWGQVCSGTSELDRLRLIPHSNDGLRERIVSAVGLARGSCEQPFGDAGSGTWAVTVTRDAQPQLARLTATIDAPAEVRAGDVLQFSVTLANPTSEPVSFGPAGGCPVVMFSLGGQAVERHLLRCGNVPEKRIDPGAAVRFLFEVRAPRNGSDGSKDPQPVALTWAFEALDNSGASVPVTITD